MTLLRIVCVPRPTIRPRYSDDELRPAARHVARRHRRSGVRALPRARLRADDRRGHHAARGREQIELLQLLRLEVGRPLGRLRRASGRRDHRSCAGRGAARGPSGGGGRPRARQPCARDHERGRDGSPTTSMSSGRCARRGSPRHRGPDARRRRPSLVAEVQAAALSGALSPPSGSGRSAPPAHPSRDARRRSRCAARAWTRAPTAARRACGRLRRGARVLS
jgi:hypothetical protein